MNHIDNIREIKDNLTDIAEKEVSEWNGGILHGYLKALKETLKELTGVESSFVERECDTIKEAIKEAEK